MSLIVKQSFSNILIILFAFTLGALNTLFFYPSIIGTEFYGIILILLAQSNIIQPIFSFGLQHSVIKFFSSVESKEEKDKILISSLIFPLFVIVPISVLFVLNYNFIGDYLSTENHLIKKYIYIIILIAISTAYFEIFYSWCKVQKKTVFGNFLKEFYQRFLITILLFLYFFKVIDFKYFTYFLIFGYYLRLVFIILYSLSIYSPSFKISVPKNLKEVLYYSILIFLSGFGASIIIDVDAAMLGKLVQDEIVAYYKIAIFITAIIDSPSRALFQILNPMVAETINKNNIPKLEKLYKKSSSNLLLVSGFISVLICSNIDDIYEIIHILNSDNGFKLAIPVVFYISISKLSSALVGCVNSIISNSKYYYTVPFFSISSAITVIFLNIYLIDKIGFIGAAISTMIVIILFNFLKLSFVMYKFKIQPFSKKTLYILALILSNFLIFYNINISDYFLINIVIKCIFIFFTYLLVSYFMNLSKELNSFLKIRCKEK